MSKYMSAWRLGQLKHWAASSQNFDDETVWEMLDEITRSRGREANDAETYVRALHEISKGCGRFSRDPLTHADNCIEDMKAMALAAIRPTEPPDAAERE